MYSRGFKIYFLILYIYIIFRSGGSFEPPDYNVPPPLPVDPILQLKLLYYQLLRPFKIFVEKEKGDEVKAKV